MKDKVTEIIEKVMSFNDLSEGEAADVMNLIMEDKINDCTKAAFLTALRMKGESVPELSGFAGAMLGKAVLIDAGQERLVDTCGSGGDGKNTFNISTTAALIAAGAGVKIAKHGNRSVSSLCGSADVLEALGVNLNISPEIIKLCIQEAGMGFIYAPLVHPAMFHASKTRKELGFKTVFNILGPIVNPALPKYRVMGVYDKGYTQKVAKVLKKLAVVRALVFTGSDGMDEISIFSSTHVTELINGRLINYIFEPGKYGFRYSSGCGLKDLQGGSAGENAKIISDILQGKEKGIKKDIAVINAAAVIYVSEKTPDFGQAVEMAEESVENGKAAGILNKMILLSNKKI